MSEQTCNMDGCETAATHQAGWQIDNQEGVYCAKHAQYGDWSCQMLPAKDEEQHTGLIIIEVPLDANVTINQAAKTAAYGVWSIFGGATGPTVRLAINDCKDAVLKAFEEHP